MKQRSKSYASTGVLALALLALIYGLTAVMARYFGTRTGVFEQWYLRYAIGAIFCIILFHGKISYRKFLHLSQRDAGLIVVRVILGSVIAVALYTLAAQKAKIGPVAFMQVLPTTALLGVILLKERISRLKAALVLLSFLGAAIVVVTDTHDLLTLNVGELLSFVSGALFSLVFILRKWQTKALNNYELTFAVTILGAIFNYILSIILYHRLAPVTASWSTSFMLLLVVAGFLSTLMNLLVSYGFEHVSAVVASSILDLEQVFGCLFGYLIYHETLTPREVIGGLIILGAALSMNRLNNREERELKAMPAPD